MQQRGAIKHPTSWHAMLEDNVLLLVIGFVVAFTDAFGMGANDVSASFGTSVGSGTLTMLQACTIALFTEFFGAAVLGSNNAKTIAGLAQADEFSEEPGILMLVMTCALVGSSLWTITASKIGLPVSSTHATAGAVIGSVWLLFGADYVNWSLESGVAKIILSWVTSPVLAGVLAALLYLVTKWLILDHPRAVERGLKAVPIYFALVVLIDTYLIASHSKLAYYLSDLQMLVIPIVASVVSYGLFLAYFRHVSQTIKSPSRSMKPKKRWFKWLFANIDRYDLEHSTPPNTDPVEELFGYVQVLTAIFASISHGAKSF